VPRSLAHRAHPARAAGRVRQRPGAMRLGAAGSAEPAQVNRCGPCSSCPALRRAPACTRSYSWHTGAHNPPAGLACGRSGCGARGVKAPPHGPRQEANFWGQDGAWARHLVDLVGRHVRQACVQARERGGREARDHVVGDDHRRNVVRAAGRQALGHARGRRKRIRPALQLPARPPRMSRGAPPLPETGGARCTPGAPAPRWEAAHITGAHRHPKMQWLSQGWQARRLPPDTAHRGPHSLPMR